MRDRLRARPLAPEWGLYPSGERPSLAESVRAHIQKLDEPSASVVWNELVQRNQYRHPNQLPRRHWAHTHTAVGPDWSPVFNSWLHGSIDPDPVTAFLRAELPWPDEVPVVFVSTRDSAMLATWGAFVAAWPHFLFLCSDEQPLLVSWERSEFVAWGCNGFVGAGMRGRAEPSAAPDGDE